jgi:hypothetical protein
MASGVVHRLSFAVRFLDHFTGEPVEAELPVRLAGSLVRPVPRVDRRGRRHPDGTYRFVNTPPGRVEVLWRAPFAASHAGWTSWSAPTRILVPPLRPEQPVDITLWPSSDAAAPAGRTAVYGNVVGGAAGLEVRIGGDPANAPHFTHTDGSGAFLYFTPDRPPANDTSGLVKVKVLLRDRAGAVVAIKHVRSTPPPPPNQQLAADEFLTPVGAASRITVTPA